MNFSDFDTTGFAVVADWLTAEETKVLADDYYASEESDNQNQKTHIAKRSTLLSLKDKVEAVLEAINTQTSLHVDLITPEAVYFNTEYMKPGWHQDHESFYILQQHTNYLNFYIIVEKEDPETSGISLISLDTVHTALKLHTDKIIGQGAKTYIQQGPVTIVKCDDTGNNYILPVRLDNIATSPVLRAGDLLLMRGDVIHKTQDGEAKRLALSIRCTDGAAPVTKAKLLSGCDAKKEIIAKHQRGFDYVLNKLGENESITALELYGNLE